MNLIGSIFRSSLYIPALKSISIFQDCCTAAIVKKKGARSAGAAEYTDCFSAEG